MVNSLWISGLVGCALGFLSGLGVGGGSLLMLWLTAVAGTNQDQARLMNLMFFLPCALIATLFRWKQGALPFKPALFATIAGLAGAWLGVILNRSMDPLLLKKGLGILFLICGVREIRYRDRKFR